MVALDQFPSVYQFMALVDLLAQEDLDTIERTAIYQGRMHARKPLVAVLDLSNVAAVAEDRMQLATREAIDAARVGNALLRKVFTQRIDCVPVVGVRLEDVRKLLAMIRVDDHTLRPSRRIVV